MSDKVKIFVSYSHQDSDYLKDDSLIGYLKPLEQDGVEIWTDRRIPQGEDWDRVIAENIQSSQLALVLVSQAFLSSGYCQNVEIRTLLDQQAHLMPVILSACEWKRHQWLARRQCLPRDNRNIEKDYAEPGPRKELFLELLEQLRQRVEIIRKSSSPEFTS